VCDRRKVDPRTYTQNWSTGIWVAGFAIGHDDVKLWHPGEPVPQELTQAIESKLPIISHDTPFKRALFIDIMGPRYGWPIPVLEQWVCTEAMAAEMALPRGLDDAAKAVGITELKDKEALSLLRRMARPRWKTRVRCYSCGKIVCAHHEMFKTTLERRDEAEDRARLDGYCIQDVLTERALFALLPPLSQSAREKWLLDQAANERGSGFDTAFTQFTAGIAESSAVTTNGRQQGAPEVVPDWIRDHVRFMHMLAEPLAGQGKVVAAGFGEDPDKTDPKTGKPGGSLPPKVVHAAIGEVNETLNGLAQFVKLPHYNMYLPLAVFRPDLPSWAKGYERDIVACLGIVADFDDPDATRWAERLPMPPNYVLQTSNGRFQAFYLFDKPELWKAVKPVAERLKAFAGCDHGTSDISHVWRVPGALNWPNTKKVAAGRPRDPQLVRVEKFDRGRTSLQELSAALPDGKTKVRPKSPKSQGSSVGGQELHNRKAHSPHDAAVEGAPENLDALQRLLSLPPELQEQIKQPGAGDRSKALFKVIAKMIEAGLDDKMIENLVRAHPKGIGEKYADRDDLDREIARVREKTAVPSQDNKITSLISDMNIKYAVVDDNGKTVVVYRREDVDLNRKYVV
jgi:DNA-directed RNA polymerase subunit N (RpoN/RPB10)